MRFVSRMVVCACALAANSARGDDFNVATLPGLQWWADSQDSTLAANPNGTGSVADGSPVGFLSDLSGNGNNGVMGNSLFFGGDYARPTLAANLIDGHPGLEFNGFNFLSLQHSLFNGATAGTFILDMEGANYFPTNNSSLFGSTSLSLALDQFGPPIASARVNGGPTINLLPAGNYGPVWGVTSAEGPESNIVFSARFQPGGESDIWENNVLVASTTTGSIGQTLNSPAVSLLGTQNFATAAAAISVPPTTPSQFNFLEGMATRCALSNSQLTQAYNYLTRRYSGTQNVAISPNLYWNAAQNSDRILPVPINAGHIEARGAGDGNIYIFHTSMIEKYDTNWNLITSNQAIATNIDPGATSFHSGGGTYLAGKIFAPLEAGLGPDGQWIGVLRRHQATACR